MLPFEEALEVRKAVMGYIASQYPLSDPAVMESMQSFLKDPETGLFKGPFVSASLPFKSPDPSETETLSDYLEVRPNFTPYSHQMKAFKRLSTWDYQAEKPRTPEPVILTTGTGSGKTECFLFPVLDYCLRMNREHSGEENGRKRGVKVIIMYPMNALASDQAKRLAQEIYRLPRDCNGKPLVTAGLLIGQSLPSVSEKGGKKGTRNKKATHHAKPDLPKDMGQDHIIEDRETIIREAPDIILTNFKMLDMSLMLEEFHPLWAGNIPDAEESRSGEPFKPCLRFMILDEIHTYDGAQGSDVANLIRRLKLKLGLRLGDLCPVGTSATIGEDSIAEYASRIFGEPVDPEKAIIKESRLSLNEFLNTGSEIPGEFPDVSAVMNPELSLDSIRDLDIPELMSAEEIYLDRVSRVWFPAYAREFPDPLEKIPGVRDSCDTDKAASGELRPGIVRDISARRFFRGRCLRGLQGQRSFWDIISAITMGSNITADILVSYVEKSPEFRKQFADGRNSGIREREVAEAILRELLDLISGSDAEDATPGVSRPFLYVRITMWIRELSSLARSVSRTPSFVFTKQSRRPELNNAVLPMWCCRKCGGSGWVAVLNQAGTAYEHSMSAIGRAFMNDSPDIRILVPRNDPNDALLREYVPEKALPGVKYRTPVISGALLDKKGTVKKVRISSWDLQRLDDSSSRAEITCGDEDEIAELLRQVPAYEYRFNVPTGPDKSSQFREVCPFCLKRYCISLVGGHVSYLSSVAMNAVMASEASGKKASSRRLLVFSNAVQNAVFLSGVYDNRSFRFAFRHAMMEYFRHWKKNAAPELRGSGITLKEYVSGFVSYFTDLLGHGDPLARDFIAFFRPPKELMRFRYEDYWHSDAPAEDDIEENQVVVDENHRREFLNAFQDRMVWECVNEFAGSSDDGRSLEVTGTMAVGFDAAKLRGARDLVRKYWGATDDERRISPMLVITPEDSPEQARKKEEKLMGFISSVLHAFRVKGVVENPYMSCYRDRPLKDIKGYILNKSKSDFIELRPDFSFYNVPRLATVEQDEWKHNDKYHVIETVKISEKGHSRYYELFSRAFFPKHNNVTFADQEGVVRKFYVKLFQALEESGLLMRLNPGTAGKDIGELYYIPQEAVRISDAVSYRECPECGFRTAVIEDAPGADFHICPVMMEHSFQMSEGGTDRDYCLERLSEIPQDNRYYRNLYTTSSSPRITAREHTGILNREVREKTEISFRKGFRGETVNVLSATATLEMGIDIGDLNTLILAGLPENTASYLQRTGRAGRKEGSSLVLNFARAGSRYDLYYFDKPLELMQGAVTTPGCFLESFDIIRRHFLAYCFDTALTDSFKTGDKTFCIPKASLLETGLIPGFVAGIEKYVSDHRAALLSRFRTAYEPFEKNKNTEVRSDAEQDSVENDDFRQELLRCNELFRELNEYVESGSMIAAIRDEFTHLRDTVRELSEEKIRCEEDLDKAADQDRKRELAVRLRMLKARIFRIVSDKKPLEFLVDQGVLPNYAFPEKGVNFTGQLLDFTGESEDEKDGREYRKMRSELVELTEPANVALTALAPDNTFYSNGHRFVIMGTDPLVCRNRGSFAEYYYCGKCDGLFTDIKDQTCPKCGASGLNRHAFMGMPGMLSEMSRSDASLLGRTKEERDICSYITQNHFSFESRKGVAYAIPEIPFGVEFWDKVRITSVNYGNDKESDRESPCVNGRNVKNHGFVVCTGCGKITSLWDYNEQHSRHSSDDGDLGLYEKSKKLVYPEDRHFRFCKYRYSNSLSDTIPGNPGERVFRETWLTREFATEAMRILLPSFHNLSHGNGNNGTEKGEMVRAVLRQGLKAFYGGSPDHLDFVFYNEYNPRTENFDEYLVIYDRVPGGTGYLKKLMEKYGDQEKRLVFQDVLEAGFKVISSCKCSSDGCYSCVNFYGQSRKLLKKSRTIKYIKSILKQTESVVTGFREYPAGLSELRKNDEPDESVLEGDFLSIMENYAESHGDTFKAVNDDICGDSWLWQGTRTEHAPEGVRGYSCRSVKFEYLIVPQADIPREDLVKMPLTVPDYMFEVRNYEEIIDGDKVSGDVSGLYRVLLYLDGYQYHACSVSGGWPGFFSDLSIREKIRKGNAVREVQYLPWTLTWDDIAKYRKDEVSGNFTHDVGECDSIFGRYLAGLRDSNRSVFLSKRLQDYQNAARDLELDSRRSVPGCDKFYYGRDAFSQLLFVLLHPNPDYLRKAFFGFVAMSLAIPKAVVFADSVINLPFADNAEDLKAANTATLQALQSGKRGEMFLAGQDPFSEKEESVPRIFFSLAQKQPLAGSVHFRLKTLGQEISGTSISGANVSGNLNKSEWRHFWHTYNLLAMLPHYAEITCQEHLIRNIRESDALPGVLFGSGDIARKNTEQADSGIRDEQNDNLGRDIEIIPLPDGFEPLPCKLSDRELRYYPGITEAMQLLGTSGLLGRDFVVGEDYEDGDYSAAFVSEPLKLAVGPGEDADLYFADKGYLVVLYNDDIAIYERLVKAGKKAVFSKDFRICDIPGCQQ